MFVGFSKKADVMLQYGYCTGIEVRNVLYEVHSTKRNTDQLLIMRTILHKHIVNKSEMIPQDGALSVLSEVK